MGAREARPAGRREEGETATRGEGEGETDRESEGKIDRESEGKNESEPEAQGAEAEAETEVEAGGEPAMIAPARPGTRAPDFNLPLVGSGYRGLADLVEPGGGVIVFFKDSCPASEMVIPRLTPLSRALEAEERFFLAVAQETEEAARSYIGRHKLPFRVAWEGAPYRTSSAYGVVTVPTLFVVDGTGVIAERVEGFIKSEYLALGAGIEQALALGRAPSVLDRLEELPDIKPG